MVKIIIKPSSEKEDDKWMPAGVIEFPDGASMTERIERCFEKRFDTKEGADKYFLEACKKKYKIINS